ncbi:MAG: rubrerythrin family protein [Halobacteriota archaeon]|nr:rubrerythrin family protein [Halobacteriota archaeon]
MSVTDENLKTAFAGESQANRRYLAFAKQAEEDGFPNIARIFRVAAESETVHALNQIVAMGGVGPTQENLKEAMKGEEYEAAEMYPKFLEDARKEDRTDAIISFTWIKKVEKTHENMYKDAIEHLEKGGDVEVKEYYVCLNCGHPEEGAAPSNCPVCGAPSSMFKKVD